MVHTHRMEIETQGAAQVLDLSEPVREAVGGSGIGQGLVCISVVGSTAGVTTTEAEPGLMNHDLKAAFERIAPENGHYEHEKTWNDDNGHSHVRASLIGPSLTLPVVDGQPVLGQWQQVVLIDFDTRPRQREVIVLVMGEPKRPR